MSEPEHKVWASSFADPADVKAFKLCKAAGGSDQECFEVGDNGVGFWGDDVSEGTEAACALPPEVISFFGLEHNSVLEIRRADAGKWVDVKLRDHMPHISTLERKNRKFRIDLNPTACELLGIRIPAEQLVVWRRKVIGS